MKILVVGGAGYVGGHMVDRLGPIHDVTVYDNLLFESRYLKSVQFIYGDVRDTKKLSKIINNYEVVVWLAGIVGDGACAVNPSLTNHINFDSVKWLVENYRGKIAFPSTCSIYGINNNLINEEAAPNPLSLYAATKLQAEKYIRKHSDNYIIFRLGTLFGLSDEHSRIRLDLVANILSMRAAEGKPLTVFGGDQWRPLLHVKDVAEAFVYSLENEVTGYYNLSYENYRIRDLAYEIASVIPETQVNYVEMPFEDLRNYRVSSSKYAATGWCPKYSLEHGIKEIRDVIIEQRIKNTEDIMYSNVKYMQLIESDKK